jgi:hypothetical protein
LKGVKVSRLADPMKVIRISLIATGNTD